VLCYFLEVKLLHEVNLHCYHNSSVKLIRGPSVIAKAKTSAYFCTIENDDIESMIFTLLKMTKNP
jgi:hypothetical protein